MSCEKISFETATVDDAPPPPHAQVARVKRSSSFRFVQNELTPVNECWAHTQSVKHFAANHATIGRNKQHGRSKLRL